MFRIFPLHRYSVTLAGDDQVLAAIKLLDRVIAECYARSMSEPTNQNEPNGGTSFSRDTWLKIALWVLPLVFMGGSLHLQGQITGDKAERTDSRLTRHEAVPGHPVIIERVEALEADTREMLHEQRVIRQEQARVIENISAICQATGARCR